MWTGPLRLASAGRAQRRSAALAESQSNRSGVNLQVPDQPTLDLVGKGQARETDDLAPQVILAQSLDGSAAMAALMAATVSAGFSTSTMSAA